MIITLNPDLKPTTISGRVSPQEWLDSGHRQLARHISSMSAESPELVRELTIEGAFYARGFMDIASNAYSLHHGLEIGPHTIWYIVLTQLAEAINADPESCRHLFTKSDEKVEILIAQDHATDINVLKLLEAMRPLLPVDADVFLPDLSTHTPQSLVACTAAFADALRAYYDYGMFCCGIPKIDLTGTREDWELLYRNAVTINAMFAPIQKMRTTATYLERVIGVLTNIVSTFYTADNNQEFWLNTFRQKNVGSGGDMLVNGWIVDLYKQATQGQVLRGFHHTISLLPYRNVSTGESFVMTHGAFGSKLDDSNIARPQYDHATFRVKPK